ncbi:hypothetical protein CC86DRAFT_410299 [Ophiobolus disseminans]|uniref:Uncharacterized protein n=1 Tax=Ophiobolus disseminans TaxID=1469910 RepID=A0A6A6ZNP9_9PLEO|nr:hypothetical protein CC86DRAFT_410299 [Ophiobolus disseminans]
MRVYLEAEGYVQKKQAKAGMPNGNEDDNEDEDDGDLADDIEDAEFKWVSYTKALPAGGAKVYSDDKPNYLKPVLRLRPVTDQNTWTITLNIDGVTPPTVPDAVIESTTFEIHAGDQQERPVCYQTVSVTCSLNHPVLKYRYLTADQCMNDDELLTTYSDSITMLDNRLEEATAVELSKMKPEYRPLEYVRFVSSYMAASDLRRSSTQPANWKYYDDQVLKQLDKLWKVHSANQVKNKEKAAAAAGLDGFVDMVAKKLKTREG